MPNSLPVFTVSINDNSIFSIAQAPNHFLVLFFFYSPNSVYHISCSVTSDQVTNILCWDYYCKSLHWNVNQVMPLSSKPSCGPNTFLLYLTVSVYLNSYIYTYVSYWLQECWALRVPYFPTDLCTYYFLCLELPFSGL